MGAPIDKADASALIQGLASLQATIKAAFPRATGTFTMAAAASLAVAAPTVTAASVIDFTPTNAAGAPLRGSAKSRYAVATPGVGFTVSTASGVAAAGTESFAYVVQTPV